MERQGVSKYDPAQAVQAGHSLAVFAGGCFWCIEAVFEQVPGVVRAVSGYTGGSVAFPDYEAVCTGRTGHAEAVLLEFNPAKVSYRQLLDLFWRAHDPTSLNRQGADAGTQYRSAVFWTTPEQADIIAESLVAQAGLFDRPLVTEVARQGDFWVAEAWHQDYYRRNPGQGYCAAVIRPKLQKLQKDIQRLTL